MTTIEEIRKDKEKAEARLDEAGAELKKFKEGEDDGTLLKKLRGGALRNELNEKEEQERARLEEEEKRLKKNVDDRLKQVEYLQNKLAEFGKEEGNEQIV